MSESVSNSTSTFCESESSTGGIVMLQDASARLHVIGFDVNLLVSNSGEIVSKLTITVSN